MQTEQSRRTYDHRIREAIVESGLEIEILEGFAFSSLNSRFRGRRSAADPEWSPA
jgi:hypothetical protein